MGAKVDGFPDTWLEDDLIDSIDPFCSLEEPENLQDPTDDDFITADAVQVKVEVSPTCPYCYSQFADQLSLEEHVELCPKSIPDADDHVFLEKNREPKVEEDPIKIEQGIPAAVTSTRNNAEIEVLRKPIILPQMTRKYTCKLCSAKFRYSHHLTRHQKVHSLSSDRPHKCSYCSASFISSYQLTRHKLIHGPAAVMSSNSPAIILKKNSKPAVQVTELKFQFCELCLTGFSNRKNYDIHKKIHIGQKLYKCGECSAAWKTKEELMGHMRRHTSNSANTSAANPVKTAATTIPKLPPGISISPITKMVPKKVSRPIPASIPISFLTPNSSNSSSSIIRYKTIVNSSSMNNRLKTHQVSSKKTVPHQVAITSSSSINRSNSSRSSSNNNRKSGKGKFVCEVCGHNFQRGHHLTRHRLIHTGERPHKCHMCPKSYSRKEHLTAHLKTHQDDTATDQIHFLTENLTDQVPRAVKVLQSNSISYDEDEEEDEEEEATEIMGI